MTYEAILAETLDDTAEFIEATADLFANAMDTDAEIEARCARMCALFGVDQRIAEYKALRDRAIAAVEIMQKIAQDYFNKRPQSGDVKHLGAHLHDLVTAHAERQADRRSLRGDAANDSRDVELERWL